MTELPWDLLQAMQSMEALPLDPSDAVHYMVREWLTSMGQLPVDQTEHGPN